MTDGFGAVSRRADRSEDRDLYLACMARAVGDVDHGRDTEVRYLAMRRGTAAEEAGYLEGLAAARAQTQQMTGRFARAGGRRG